MPTRHCLGISFSHSKHFRTCVDLRDSLEAAGEADKGAGRKGSRGTGPRPPQFNPWDWWRDRRRKKADDAVRVAQRPWADLVGDRGAAAGFDILERQAAMQAGEDVEAETTTAPPLTSSSSFEELHARMDEEAERIVSAMGPDPAFALMKDKLQADKLAWERQKRETEAWEGVPYELGHLLPAARRSGMMDDSIRVGRTGWRRFLGGRSETGGEAAGGGDFLLEPAPPRAPPRPTPVELQRAAVTRILGGGRRRTAGPAGGLEGRVRPARRHGKEPLAPEDAPFVTVGDVLKMCNVRLRRLPLAYAAREMSTGQALLDELQVRVGVALMPRLINALIPRVIRRTIPNFVSLCFRLGRSGIPVSSKVTLLPLLAPVGAYRRGPGARLGSTRMALMAPKPGLSTTLPAWSRTTLTSSRACRAPP